MVATLQHPSQDRLAELRTRLDAVDAGLHRLLRERFEIVEEIAAVKGGDDPVIRPTREAAVLENRLSLHTGPMPAETLAHIFRALIGGACAVQRPLTVHVTRPLEAMRFLYGPVPAVAHASASEAVAALGENPCDVAVLDGEDHGPFGADRWWRHRGDAHVVARYLTSEGQSVIVVGGAGVARGTGPEALVVRAGDDQPTVIRASDIVDGDDVLGRVHPFCVTIPVARPAVPPAPPSVPG